MAAAAVAAQWLLCDMAWHPATQLLTRLPGADLCPRLPPLCLQGQEPTSALVPGTYCAQINATSNSTLVQFLAKAAGPQLAALLVPAAAGGNASAGAGAGAAAAGALLGNLGVLNSVRVQCVDSPASFQASSGDIDQKLYCGYYQAKCSGVIETSQYTTAFDFSSASASSMSVAVYYNDSISISGARGGGGGGGGGGNTPVRYLRLSGLVNMAVNSWVEKFLGETPGLAWPGHIGPHAAP
jgi:hypothetical protein